MAELQDELVITLRKPVKLGAEIYESLTLREPTAGEVEKATAEGGGQKFINTLVGLVAGVPRPAIDKIGVRDVAQAGDYLLGFINAGQTTGEV